MADFLDEKRREMKERLKELRPLVDEYHRLEAAVAALDGVAAAPSLSSPAPATRRKPARRSGATRTTGAPPAGAAVRRAAGRAARRRSTLVRNRPGITIPELADAMKIKQNYLYRVMPGLQQDGLVKKEGKGWYPLDAA